MSETFRNSYLSRASINDHLFWIFFFLFTDPGGLIKANSGGKYYVNFVIFIFLTFLFIFTPGVRECLKSQNIRKISLAILLWGLYYLIIFGLLNNNSTDFYYFLKNGFLLPFTALCFFFYTYFFAVRNMQLFIKYLLLFSLIVFSLFFITYFTDFKLLPLRVYSRGYVEQNRVLLFNYGLLSFTIAFTINILFFRIKIKEKKWMILAASIMIVLWIIAISRRQLLEFFASIVVTYILAVKLKYIRQFIPVRLMLFLLIPVLVIFIFFPGYLGATRQSLAESYSVLTEGQSTTGQKDTRLSLTGQNFILEKFFEKPILGTGFDPVWYSSEGDRKGYEASDYIFLGALAQHGILGLLFFLPLYVLIYKTLFSEFRALKKSRGFIYLTEYDRMIIYYILTSFFLKIIIYVNYFVEAGWAVNAHSFYMVVGILYAIRYRRIFSEQTLNPVPVNGVRNL